MIIMVMLILLMICNTALSFKINHGNIIVRNNMIAKSNKYNKLFMSNTETNQDGYSKKQILKEETEAPFRSLRKFIYFSLLAGAGLGTAITIIKLLVPSANDNYNELLQNLAINGGGAAVLLYLLNRENVAQQALLERIKKGGSLAGFIIIIIIINIVISSP